MSLLNMTSAAKLSVANKGNKSTFIVVYISFRKSKLDYTFLRRILFIPNLISKANNFIYS
jgi:hypothetical protein